MRYYKLSAIGRLMRYYKIAEAEHMKGKPIVMPKYWSSISAEWYIGTCTKL